MNNELYDILKKTDEPFFVLELNKLKENYDIFFNAFQKRYNKFNIAYSYKTNYIPQICSYVNSRDGIAEVVSEMELDLALKLKNKKIIFNGPVKSISSLKKALKNNIIINIDSLTELLTINEITKRDNETKINLGIRFNLQLEDNNKSRFGVAYKSKEYEEIIKIIKNDSRYNLICLHTHIIASLRNCEIYELIAERLSNIYNDLKSDFNIEYLDLGGGFYSEMEEEYKRQFNYYIPTIEEYAISITNVLNKNIKDNKPYLILEPGLAIVANIMNLYASVCDIKRLNDTYYAYLNISKYDLKPTGHKKDLPIQIVETKKNKSVFYNDLILTGNTCMEDDILYSSYNGKLAIGDYVVFKNVGAYSIVLRPDFIHPMPMIYIVDLDNNLILIKKKESMNEVFRKYFN